MEMLVENALNIGADEFYRASRYNLPLVVLLVNSEDTDAFDILESSVRQTDILQQLTSDTAVVFLSHTSFKDSKKFIEKIKQRFDFTYTVSEFKSSENHFLKRLFIENEKKCITI